MIAWMWTLLAASAAPGETVRLEDALAVAQADNPALRSARANLEIAELGPGRAWSAFVPSVSAIGSYTRNNTAAELAFPDFTAGFEVTDDGRFVPSQIDSIVVQAENQLTGQIRAEQGVLVPSAMLGIGAARAGARAARWGTDQAEREILFATAELYLGCVALQEAVRVTSESVALLEDHLRAVEASFAAGSSAEIAVLRARLDLQNAVQDLNRVQRDRANALGQLATLMGRDDATFEVEAPQRLGSLLDGEPPGAVQELDEAEVLARRASIRSSEESLEAARRQKAATTASFLPTVGLQFNYQYSNVAGFAGQNDVWSATAALNVPILQSGNRVRDLREASARVREAEAALDDATLSARQDLREALRSTEAARVALATARETARLARRSWEAINASFGAGAATPLEVADASSNLRKAELSVVNEAVNLVSAELRLARARGARHPRPVLVGEEAP